MRTPTAESARLMSGRCRRGMPGTKPAPPLWLGATRYAPRRTPQPSPWTSWIFSSRVISWIMRSARVSGSRGVTQSLEVPIARLALEEVWRRGSGSNRRIKVLQTSPLPLGYRAPQGLRFGPRTPDQQGRVYRRRGVLWSGRPGSNRRHLPWQGSTLPLSYSRSYKSEYIGLRCCGSMNGQVAIDPPMP
jgi:hypothetical protein